MTQVKTMRVEELQAAEREVQLRGNDDPAGTLLPDGTTLADLRKRQAEQAMIDRQEARAFDERSAEANRVARAPVAVSVSPSGVIEASPVVEPGEKALTDEEEIAARGAAADDRDAARILASVEQGGEKSLDSLTVPELKAAAAGRQIEGFEGMKKSELIAALGG